MDIIESGNNAAALGVLRARAQVIAAYPITPQTPLTEKLSEFVAAGEMQAEYIPVESEHSAMAVCIAASSTGARAFTATSANGLLYMHEQVCWAAGARLPLVMCVVNRGLGAPWTVWNDHQDSMTQRDTGWIQLYCNDHQQIIDTTIKAYHLAETVSIPVMVCFDGYLLSHTYMPFDLPEQDVIDEFLPSFKPAVYLDPKKPINLNTVTMPESRLNIHGQQAGGYMEIRHSFQQDLRASLDCWQATDERYQKLTGRGGNPFIESYRTDDADTVAVALGSLSYQLRDVIDGLRAEGLKVGVASLGIYRPFPDEAVRQAFKDVKRLLVFEKALSLGYEGPLCTDLRAALSLLDNAPVIGNRIVGLGGREIETEQLAENLRQFCRADKPATAPSWIGLRDLGA